MIEYQKESGIVMGLFPREFMIAPITLADDWTEIRCGMFVTGRDFNNDENAADDFAGFENEDPDNGIYFGLKNSDTFDLPGEAGSIYLGIKPKGGFPFDSYSKWDAYNIGIIPPRAVTRIGDAVFKVSACGFDGVTLVDGGEIKSPNYTTGAIRFTDYVASEGYCGLYVMKFVINHRGASNQSVTMSLAQKASVDGFDYSPFALRQEMNNAEFGPAITIAWNTGGSARDIPDAFYIRMPFYDNMLTIAAMRVIKYQPE